MSKEIGIREDYLNTMIPGTWKHNLLMAKFEKLEEASIFILLEFSYSVFFNMEIHLALPTSWS